MKTMEKEIREIARDLHANIISVNDGVSAINLLLDSQKEGFVKIINNLYKCDKYPIFKKDVELCQVYRQALLDVLNYKIDNETKS